jgi:hypothetical protein
VSQDEPQIIPDGSGGVIIVWQSTSRSGPGGVFAQHIDREGRATWGANGVPVCTISSRQLQPALTSDSSGGVIVVWQDNRSGSGLDVYAQRIDRSGALRWGQEGLSVSSAPGDQILPQITSDGRGGALLAWRDLRVDLEGNLCAQAIDSAGRARWASDGIAVSTGPGGQLVSQVVANGRGGGIFIWSDTRGDRGAASIHAQRIDLDGDLAWGPQGVLVADGARQETRPVAAGDGIGNAIIVWESGPLYAQRLDQSGRRLWGDGGVALSTTDGLAPAIVSDGYGGAIVAWQTASFDDASSDIRAQAIRVSGALRWGGDGIPVCRASGAQSEVAMARSGAGSAIVMWRDARNDESGDLYAQRIDSSGTAHWKTDGIVISDAPGFQGALAVSADGTGGAVAAWSDGRDGRHIYAQRVSGSGRLGGARAGASAASAGRGANGSAGSQ